jgi:hypothetical protein
VVRWIKLPTVYVVKDNKKEREMWIMINVDFISHIEPYFTSEDLSMDDEKIIITLATDEKIACNLSLEEFSQISKHEIIDGVNGVDQDTNRDTLGDFEPI